MPFANDSLLRSLDRESTLADIDFRPLPSFSETSIAAFELAQDEDLSISFLLNREMFRDRRSKVESLISRGAIDSEEYELGSKGFDYNRLSKDLENTEFAGLIKTDRTLEDERKEMLRIRRERNQDVIDRGSGFAQFLGAGTALMTDPVNLLGMGGGLFLTAARSGTVLGRAMYGLKTEAGIAAASEMAIQPLVYAHKNNIDSPYSAEQAFTNIATAATFGGALGFTFGGIGGYFSRIAEKSREGFVNSLPNRSVTFTTPSTKTNPTIDATTTVTRTFNKNQINETVKKNIELEESLEVARKELNDFIDELDDQYETGAFSGRELREKISGSEQQKKVNELKNQIDETNIILEGIIDATQSEEFSVGLDALRRGARTFRDIDQASPDNANKILNDFDLEYKKILDEDAEVKKSKILEKIDELNKKIKRISKKEKRLVQWIVDRGGLNRQAFSEYGDWDFQQKGLSSKFWRKTGGLRPDDLVEALIEDPTLAFDFRFRSNEPQPKDVNDGIEWLRGVLANPDQKRDPGIESELVDLREQLKLISKNPDALAREEQLFELFESAAIGLLEDQRKNFDKLLDVERAVNNPNLTEEDYINADLVADRPETDIEIKSAERGILESLGLSEDHDKIMAAYRELAEEDTQVTMFVGDAERPVGAYIDELEQDLRALDALRECVRSV